MSAHPPAHEVPEAWHEDLSEQGVAKDHFICMKCLESGGRWIWRILVVVGVWLFLIALLGAVWLLTSVLLASGAYAHEAVSGFQYPMSCCWSPQTAPAGRAGDCSQIPSKSAKAIEGGYSVTLHEGEHPMVKTPLNTVVPYPKTRQSPDNEYHICFAPDMSVRCFFAPPPGV
jgi:hypothetical protein